MNNSIVHTVAGNDCTSSRIEARPEDAPWSEFRKRPVVIRAYQFTQAMIEAHLLDDAPLPEGVLLGSAHYHRGRREDHRALACAIFEALLAEVRK